MSDLSVSSEDTPTPADYEKQLDTAADVAFAFEAKQASSSVERWWLP